MSEEQILKRHCEFELSRMRVEYRVIARHIGDDKMIVLSSWENYSSAEESCWNYPAVDDSYELIIQKTWVKK